MDLDIQIKTLGQKVDRAKASIYQSIHKEYSEMFPSKNQQDLLKVLKPLLKDMQKTSENIKNVILPQTEFIKLDHKSLQEEYKTVEKVLSVLQILCKCHKELSLAKSLIWSDHAKTAEHLSTVKEALHALNFNYCDVKVFKDLHDDFIQQRMHLDNNLKDMWLSLVHWSETPSTSLDLLATHLNTSLKINHLCKDNSVISVTSLLQSMQTLQIFDTQMKWFSQKIFNFLMKPVITFPMLAPKVSNPSNNEKCFLLQITKRTVNLKILRTENHASIYKKILEIVRFIRASLFSDFVLKEGASHPMTVIGGYIWKTLSDNLINDHLALTVPRTNTQLDNYEGVVKAAVQFEVDLIQEDFIPPGTTELSTYLKQININFANKLRQDIFSKARDMMLEDNHNMVDVSANCDRAAISITEGQPIDKKIKDVLTSLDSIEDFFYVDLFAFPSCRVSESTQKLVDFVYTNMLKATESPGPVATQIFYSCRDIFELYANVVPTYHREAMKLPQLSALHYNNCMYLAHHCVTLGLQFRSSLPEQLNSSITTFIDYVTVLRKCGEECFLDQLRSQQQAMIAILEPCNRFTECTSDESVETIKRSFNQILNLLTRLSKLWDTVLPSNIYVKSLAVLLNTVLENIISCVFKMEDISADEAGQLHALLNILLERSQEITQDSIEIRSEGLNEHVRSWCKFELLVQMLEASLQMIVELWGDGEGELARCMGEGEVRKLVRALFQNTERRSQALSKIKHKVDNS